MSEDHRIEEEEEKPQPQRFPELEELQREVEKRIRDNRRFLENFLDDGFKDEDEEVDGEDEPFEEL